MTDIVERLRLLESGARWICNETADTLEDAADEIERLRRIINTIHPQMQARIDKLEAELAEAIERGNDWCDQAQKARAALRGVLEIEGWAQDHPRYIAARAALAKEPGDD